MRPGTPRPIPSSEPATSAMPGPESAFAPAPDPTGRSARGGAISLAAQAAKLFLGLASTVILARLLVPGDFGLIAMVAPVVGFFGIFHDLGLTMATVQREHITRAQVSALFWINVGVSAALALLVALLSPLVAAFYGDPRLEEVTLALGLFLFFSGASAQHFALLRRQMRFTRLAAIEPTALAVGIAAAVLAALWGLDYWALVVLSGAEAVTRLVMAWTLSGWWPSRPARGAGIRDMLAFGSHLTGANLVGHFVRNIDNVLMGRFWGETALGLYNRAYTLSQLPVNHISQPVSGVVIPVLCRLRNDPEQYRRYFAMALGLSASLSMPIIAFALADAELFFAVMLGERWAAAVPIFLALGPAAFLGTTHIATYWAFVSLGHTRRQLRWSLVTGATVTAAFVLGLPYGAVGMALAYSAATLALRVPGLAYCFHGTCLRVRDFFAALRLPTTASLGAGAALIALRAWLELPATGFAQLLLDGAFYGLAYGALYAAFPEGRSNLRLARNLAGGLFRRLTGRWAPPPAMPMDRPTRAG